MRNLNSIQAKITTLEKIQILNEIRENVAKKIKGLEKLKEIVSKRIEAKNK